MGVGSKGFFGDTIAFLIVLFGVGLSVVLLQYVFTTVNTQLLTALDSSQAQAAVTASGNIWTAVGQGFVLFTAFNFIALILSSFFVNSHPAFYVLFLIIAIFTLLISPIISNAYESIASDPIFIATAVSNTGMNWILLNLPLIVLSQLVVVGVVFFAKRYAYGGNV